MHISPAIVVPFESDVNESSSTFLFALFLLGILRFFACPQVQSHCHNLQDACEKSYCFRELSPTFGSISTEFRSFTSLN